ncbi:MAG TPA: hypothetical protein VJ183_18170 [Chloroflexia bacterium]|nr:hypothetical protein [Chloroflexia bacterium]
MDAGTVAIVVIGIFAVIAIVAFVFRQNFTGSVKGPLGTGIELKTSQPPPPLSPGVLMEDVTAREGNAEARNDAGSGAVMRRVEAGKDAIVTNAPPRSDPDPKA